MAGSIICNFGVLASFGIGNMTQSNSVAAALETSFGVKPLITGIILAIITGVVVVGGLKRIAAFTEKLVPFMAAVYMIGGGAIILLNIRKSQQLLH